MQPQRSLTLLTSVALVLAAGAAQGAPKGTGGAGRGSLAKYFGFDDPRIIVSDKGCGPSAACDMDGDGRQDLVVVNNAKSRIEIYRQRESERSDEQTEREFKVNELPPSRWFDRVEVSVAHRVSAFRVHDVDKDGRLDIVYAGQPGELVVMKQKKESLAFEVLSKRRVPGLSPGQDGFEIANITGDNSPELLAITDGKISLFQTNSTGVTGEPVTIGSGGKLIAFFTEDYNGDGRQDILGVIPDDASPLRLWLGSAGPGANDLQLGPETRLEMPGLVEVEPLRFPDRPAASIAVIERASKRMVLYDLSTESVSPAGATGGERDAAAEVFSFRGGTNKNRSTAVGDIDADGKLDLLVTDQSANSVVLYRQSGAGLGEGKPFSAFKEPKTVALGKWDNGNLLSAFILSEEEKSVGVSKFDASTGRLSFPQPLTIKTPGASPVAMNHVELKDGPGAAVVVKDKRDHTLEIHRPGAEARTAKLEGVSRPPQSLMGGDFDHDGGTDLLLFTPGEPMVMVRNVSGEEKDIEVLTDKKMPNFGLVQAAGADNTALLDADGDNFPELLIADKNFVRACSFNVKDGWKVVEQVTLPEASSALTGLSVLQIDSKPTIVASDKANKRLILMSRTPDGAWGVSDKLRLTGFDVGGVQAGSFSGDAQPGIMVLGDDAFALVRLAGQRASLKQFAAYRSDAEGRQEHELEAGDLNNDGFLDLVVLDAGEQMCEVFTLSASRKLMPATEWEVFESRLFSRGESREFEPSMAIIADLTGDGLLDLALAVHDRFLVYPQARQK